MSGAGDMEDTWIIPSIKGRLITSLFLCRKVKEGLALLGAARTVDYGATPHNLNNFGDGVYFANMWDAGWHTSDCNAPNIDAWVAILSYTSDPIMKIQIALGNHGEIQIRFYIKDATPYWKAWIVIHS